jgi:REP element-mobilizing transposase RayT
MPQSRVEIYLHLVWATYRRQPLITASIERALHRCIAAEAAAQECTVLALNGVEDHVHLFVKLPARFDVSRLMHRVKGVSAHTATHDLGATGFGWQDGYAALSVSPNHVQRVIVYVSGQKEHHAEGLIQAAWEPLPTSSAA